jgi:transposase
MVRFQWNSWKNTLKADFVTKKMRSPLPLGGKLSPHEQRFLAMQIKHFYQMEASVREIEEEISNTLVKFKKQIDLLDGIPGTDLIGAASVIAEISTDMNKFPSAEHICSWAGVSPGNNESAGKKVHTSN